MRYSQLKAFYHVARQGGFSRAAAYLNQSQPSLSDHVRQLERDHDVLLFTRRNRKVVLTDAGEEMFRLVRQFFDAEEMIGEFLDQSHQGAQGQAQDHGGFISAYHQYPASVQSGQSRHSC